MVGAMERFKEVTPHVSKCYYITINSRKYINHLQMTSLGAATSMSAAQAAFILTRGSRPVPLAKNSY